jgi:hypothetical protein
LVYVLESKTGGDDKMDLKKPPQFAMAVFTFLALITAFSIYLFSSPISMSGQCGNTVVGNLVQNPGFEEGGGSWSFFSDAKASFVTTSVNPYECAALGEVSIETRGSNVQLFQTGLALQPATTYRLSLAAKSTTGRDALVFIHQHGRPFTSYGLNGVTFDLTTEWQVFYTDFTVENITAPVNDGRLRIWLAESNEPGETFYFDQITLVALSTTPPTATGTLTAAPTETPMPTSTATVQFTATPTATPLPSSTPTSTPTQTATATNTTVPTQTAAATKTSLPTIAASATATNTPSGSQGPAPCRGLIDGNIIQNPGFDLGSGGWSFYSNAQATFSTTTTNPYDCERAAEIAIQTRGTNVQLFQIDIPLQPSTTYRLTMAARSTTGQDIQLFLQRHTKPYTNYGLNGNSLDLTADWQVFDTTFTTQNFTAPVADGRLRIWLSESNQPGEVYYFDRIALVALAPGNPTVTATPPPTSTATATSVSATVTPTATATRTTQPTATATQTAVPTTTATPIPTQTHTPVPLPTATATQLPGPAPCTDPINGNTILNPSFESNTTSWSFYSNAQATFITTTLIPYDCVRAAEVAIQTRGSNVQLFQAGIPLQPLTTYRLTMAARSTTGRDGQLFLQRHTSPFTDYGLNGTNLDLRNTWQIFEVTFTTKNFTSPVTDGRLRIWLSESNQPGEIYYFDKINLVPINPSPSTPTPTPTSAQPTATATPGSSVPTATATSIPSIPTATNTPVPPPPPGGPEIIIFDWNKPVTTRERGFPWDQEQDILHNGNLISPVNYAEGSFYYRAEIRDMPWDNINMRLQFCIWQPAANDTTKPYKDPYKLENCGSQQAISYQGNKVVVTWSQKVQDLWKKNGIIIDWSRPRYRNGVAIKNSSGLPVSDYNGWNWNGEDPNKWYPMDMRFTVVMVEKGKTFGGWDKYTK